MTNPTIKLRNRKYIVDGMEQKFQWKEQIYNYQSLMNIGCEHIAYDINLNVINNNYHHSSYSIGINQYLLHNELHWKLFE